MACTSCRETDENGHRKCKTGDVARVVGLCLLLCMGTVLLSIPPVRDGALSLLNWLHDHQTEGGALYVIIFTVGVVLCFPEIALAVASGYVFPFGVAAALTWLGSVVGALLAFFLGRYGCRIFLERMCLKVRVSIAPLSFVQLR